MLHLAARIAASQPDPLKPNPAELITGVIAFAVVFGVLWRTLLPRITKTLADRTDRIEGEIGRAEEAKAEADRLREQYEALLAEARHGAASLREQAREEGARIKAELQQQGDAERRRIVDAAQVQIEAERRQTIAALRGEM